MPRLTLVNPVNERTLYGRYKWQPLSLTYVAGATPAHWDVRIVDEVVTPLRDEDLAADVVGITAFTTQAPRAYEIAARARAAGAQTVIGGVHASFMPEEAARHADAVLVGEAELVWPALLADAERRALAPRYQGGRPSIDALGIIPRRDLLQPGAYTYASVQTTRGCPLNCSFCSVTAFNGRTYRATGVDWVVDEFSRIPEERVLVVDDDFNGFSDRARRRALELCQALEERAPAKRWATQMTINFGDDAELPRAAARAGCAAVFIGFESVSSSDLATVSKKRNRGRDYFADNVRRIRDAGIAVIGSFILGIDGQDVERTVDETLSFLEETHIDAFNPTLLTPLPGTRDRARYLEEQRTLHHDFPADWIHYDLATPTVRPTSCSPARLYRDYLRWMRFFDRGALLARTHRTRRELGPAAAEAAYLWNRAWGESYRCAVDLPDSVDEALAGLGVGPWAGHGAGLEAGAPFAARATALA